MSRDADNALILQDIRVYMADLGTAGPVDLSTAWAAGWLEVGWLDFAAFTETPTGTVSQLQGVDGSVLAEVKDGDGWEFAFDMIETNDNTDSILYPNQVVTAGVDITTSVVSASTAPPKKAWGLEFTYAASVTRRVIVPVGSAVPGAVTQDTKSFRKIPVTVTAIKASDGTLLTNIRTADATGS